MTSYGNPCHEHDAILRIGYPLLPCYYTTMLRSTEPFQRLYNEIANDLYQYMHGLKPAKRGELRVITEIGQFPTQDYADDQE